jgi:hypothetical protein
MYGIYEFIYIYVHFLLWNLQIWKIKKSGPPYAEGNAIGVEVTIVSRKPVYAEGQAVGIGLPLRRGQCRRRMP